MNDKTTIQIKKDTHKKISEFARATGFKSNVIYNLMLEYALPFFQSDPTLITKQNAKQLSAKTNHF